MIRLLVLIIGVSLSFSAIGQTLATRNFRDWYNPESEVKVYFKPVRTAQQIVVLYTLTTTQPLEKYSITWEKRESFTQRDGTPLTETENIIKSDEKNKSGEWTFSLPAKPWLLVVKITHAETQISWSFIKQIESNFPETGWVESNSNLLTQKYVTAGQTVKLNSEESRPFYVSFYKQGFPAAFPPFAEKEAPADRFMFHDSIFKISPQSEFKLQARGLYLFQRDTNAAEGFGLRAVNKSFPKFSSIEDLMQPLIYICTQNEFEELKKSTGDKAKFDKVILDITNDKGRAANFMKSYFKRVELANQLFSSYKEGWKTDRGMIYIIYGVPDEVSVNTGTETWYYKNSRSSFTFVKSGSVYDPDNYVLVRDKRFMTGWYSMVDLWRKSRF